MSRTSVFEHGGTKVAEVVKGPDAELGVIYTCLVPGLLGIAVEVVVAVESFVVDLDCGARPAGAVVPSRCRSYVCRHFEERSTGETIDRGGGSIQPEFGLQSDRHKLYTGQRWLVSLMEPMVEAVDNDTG
jgi:hypothetical protein